MFRSLCTLALTLALVFGQCSGVRAAEVSAGPAAATGFTLRYTADAECISEARFLAQVRARTRRDVERVPVQLSVAITRSGQQYQATMPLTRDGAAEAVRELSGANCGEAASAMAVVVALALDAYVEAENQAEEEAPAPQPAPPVTPETEPWRAGAGLAVLRDFSLGPQGVFGGALFASLRHAEDGPEFRLGGSYRAGSLSSAEYSFDVRLVAATLEACPLFWRLSAAFRLAPCVSFLSGQYSARGTQGFARGETGSQWWNAAGAGLRGSAALGAGWSLDLWGQALFPFATKLSLVADAPLSGRQITLFAVRPLSADLGLGVKLDFQ
jgi:hypothetical protein